MPYIRHKTNRYSYSESLKKLFEDLVKSPFENHERTQAWQDEVRNRDSDYQRKKILDQGRTNFDEPFKGLSPVDKVLIYCNHYMPMHLISSYHIFHVHSTFFTKLLKSVDNNVVFIDFGCGPLTSGIAFWAFAKQSKVFYLGIDSSQAMRAKAEKVNQYGPFQYLDPFFSQFKLIGCHTQLTKFLDKLFTRDDKIPIIFNFCYFLASLTLDINNLSDVMVRIVGEHSNKNMCMVHQNPDLPKLHENWGILKANLSGFSSRTNETNIQWFNYDSLITGSRHDTKVFYDILYKD